MSSVGQMLARVEAFDKIEALGTAMMNNEQDILDINREQLYERGIGKDGFPLPPYTPEYAKAKPSRGVVDLYKSGDLHREMLLHVNEGAGTYDISSYVDYAQYVMAQRPNGFGLTDEGKRETWYITRPDFTEQLKRETGMG